MAGEELLHGGLFEVPFLDDEPVQSRQQCIHIAQCRRDGALFGRVSFEIRMRATTLALRCGRVVDP